MSISRRGLLEIFEQVSEHGIENTAKLRGCTVETVKRYLRELTKDEADEEIILESIRLKKQIQRVQDTNRIERKTFREHARIENAIGELNSELINLLKTHKFNDTPKREPLTQVAGGFGIFHITDAHINELVDLHNNKYDIEIASKRYAKMVDEAVDDFESKGITHVLVAFTGDLINSDRRLDELLNMATNRSRAMFLAVELFRQVITELSWSFEVYVASVTGNESRMKKDYDWSDVLVTDNYDYSIHNILRLVLEDNDKVHFCGDCAVEKVISFGGKNILLCHGNQLGKNYDATIPKMISRYQHNGVDIDFIIFGHLHDPRIGSLYARGGSPVGANAYSENGLLLTSIASQNIYFIKEDGIDGRVITLQDYDDIIGYDLHDELMAYNAKSADRIKKRTTVFEVIV